jgi:hypothetical protein
VKRFIIPCLTAIMIIGLLNSPSYGQQVKLAQTGFNFLTVSSDATAGGMGDAVNSLSAYTGALTHNPAAMAGMPGLLNVNVSVNNWIADIKYLSFSAIVSPLSGEYGVIGLSVQSVDYGEVLGTMVWPNNQGYIDTGVMDPSALAVGIGYAKAISDHFSVGGQVRFAYQALGSSVVPGGNSYVTKQNVASAVAFDFGTIFKTGIKSLAFGMSIRNFSQDVTYEEESFQLPLSFTFGISANVLDFTELHGSNQSFILSCDVAHPTSHPEQLKIGGEYEFMKVIALRCGYITGDSEDGITYGLGISSASLGLGSTDLRIDYSYTPFKHYFNDVQRFTVSFSM